MPPLNKYVQPRKLAGTILAHIAQIKVSQKKCTIKKQEEQYNRRRAVFLFCGEEYLADIKGLIGAEQGGN